MKKYMVAFCGIVLIGSVGAFIGKKYVYDEVEIQKIQKKEPVTYYTIGKEDEDIEAVEEALNKLLLDKYDITVDYHKLDWNIYGDKIKAYLSTNEKIDVVFASVEYVSNAKAGTWYPLDDFLSGEGHKLYEAIPEVLWKGATINGHIYGVPTSKELAVVNHWMFAKELVEKYKIDLDKINTLEDLRTVFAMLKEKEPEYTLFEMNQYASFFEIYGYEYVLDKNIPLMVKWDDKEVELVNIMETELGEQVLDTLRDYYLCGYINQDAPIRKSEMLQKGKKVFMCQGQGGPFSENVWSEQRGYEITAKMMTPPVINTESVRGAYMCIPVFSDQSEEACRFLMAVNTDKEVRNMLQYGIEGEHYTLDQNGQAVVQKDTYAGIAYTQGNYALLTPYSGQPADIWEKYQAFNDSAISSEILFFEADLSSIEDEIQEVRKVSWKFYPALMTGSVDVEEYLPLYREALKEAGIEKIRKELQTQLRKWKKNEKEQNRE